MIFVLTNNLRDVKLKKLDLSLFMIGFVICEMRKTFFQRQFILNSK